MITLSAKQDMSPLLPLLDGETCVFVGQSGMGKSTLTNALLPEANARIGDISEHWIPAGTPPRTPRCTT
jgi:ribosome biogenesis GTPase